MPRKNAPRKTPARDADATITLSRAQADELATVACGKALAAENRTEAALWRKLFDAANEILAQLPQAMEKGY